MPVVEEVEVLVSAKVDPALKNLKKVDSQRDGFEKNWKKTAKVFAGSAIAGLILKKTLEIGKATINLASDAEETRNKFNVVFRDIAGAAQESANLLSEAYGLSSTAAQTLLSDTGDLLTGFGFTQESALDLSTEVNKLAVDLASFTNFAGGAEGASQALTKALLGERESVKALGISILETDVKAKVLELTQQGITFETERQAKAFATLKIAQEQSQNALGDFARSADSYANQVRIAEAATEDLGVALGERLLPVATQIASRFGEITAALSEYIGDQNLAIDFVKEFNDEGIKTAFTLEELVTIQEQLNKQTEQAGRGGSQQLKDQLVTVQALIDAYGIEDEFLKKRANEQQTQAARDAEAARLALERADLQEQAAGRLAEIEEGRKTDTEKEIELLQEEIDFWAQYRDIVGVQQLLNDLIRDRNALQTEGLEVSQSLATWDEIQADIQKRNLLKLSEEREAATNREVEAAEEVKQAWESAYADITSAALGFFSAVNDLASATQSAELERLRAQGASEEELEQKKKEIARDEAKRKKALGLLNVGIDTASAIIGFLADPGGIPGIALSALAGVTGAVQAAAIAATPLPALAEGGSFTTSGPTPLLVGDNVGGQERVTVEPVSSNGANVMNGMPSGPITLVVDGRPFTAHFQRQIDNRNIRSSRGGAI